MGWLFGLVALFVCSLVSYNFGYWKGRYDTADQAIRMMEDQEGLSNGE